MHLESCQSSGLQTSDGVVYARPCLVHAVTIVPAAAASNVVVYDNSSAASGTVLAKVAGVANGASVTVQFAHPIEALNGLYADVTGASAGYIVHFSAM